MDFQADWMSNHIENDPLTRYCLHILNAGDSKFQIRFTATYMETAEIMEYMKRDENTGRNSVTQPIWC